MEKNKRKVKKNFDQLFYTMLQNKQVEEKAIHYLHDKKKIEKAIIYNELLPRKIIGYSPERKALAFPLVRGFLIVGIQYLATESLEINGQSIKEGQEYFHEDSDIETGLFSLQRNFKDVVITSGILDLLSTDLGGVSLPITAGFKQLQLFSDINAIICFKNSKDHRAAAKKIVEMLPKINIVTLPKEFKDINHFLVERGKETVKLFLTEEDKDDKARESVWLRKEKSFEVVNTRYFQNPGPENTEAVLEAAFDRYKTLKINKMLISSCSGKTACKALDLFGDNVSLIIVTHVTGFKKPNHQELSEKNRKLLMKRGVIVLTAQHAFGGVGRAFRNKTGTYQIDEVIAYTLRIFGHGTKVAIEMALMAADAGLIRTDEDVISIGGTATGVDTALLLKPAHTQDFFDLKVKEIICKPFNL
jgi:uncharacterized protein